MTETLPRKTVVVLHGFAGHGDSWDDVRARLPGWRVEAVTLLGHDPERPLRDVVAFEDEVVRVASIIRSLGEPVRVCGYSMGGRITLGLLARFPELVGSAVLVGANPGLTADDERAPRIEGDEAWARVLEDEGMEAFAAKWQAQALFATQAGLTDTALEGQRRIRQRHDARSLAQAMRSVSLGRMPSYWDVLERAEVPIDIVVGALDTKFSQLATKMKARMRNGLGRVLLAEAVGHNVLLERPDLLAHVIASSPVEAGAGAAPLPPGLTRA